MTLSPSVDTILSGLTLLLVAVTALLQQMLGKATEAAAAKGAETAIKNLNWNTELGQLLQQARGEERQELRYTSYGALWSKLRPLALYDDNVLDRKRAATLSDELSNWYFSSTGGLLLTRESRGFYFALQDLLRAVGTTSSPWQATRHSDEQLPVFRSILQRRKLSHALATLDYFEPEKVGNWPAGAVDLGKVWQSDVRALATEDIWSTLSDSERFAVLQQVGSVLRASLTYDVESRLR